MESKIFRKVVILFKNISGSITKEEYIDTSINISGEYLILGVIKHIDGSTTETEYKPINLNEIHKFKTYNII